ncbi:hypothetical protein BDZ94DRAFT_1066032 [Collybia nuda]|uniref:Uncharacterized protein n=1 Tax=Collybia nuda TaxID=64659 RepID=A0A9P6CAZ6_9AGAR|nr:hypothetical protein BDZ94DRAFT_1066032 [Collybia nuda]
MNSSTVIIPRTLFITLSFVFYLALEPSGFDASPTTFWIINTIFFIALLSIFTFSFNAIANVNTLFDLCGVVWYLGEITIYLGKALGHIGDALGKALVYMGEVIKQKATKPLPREVEPNTQHCHTHTPINETTEASPPPYKLLYTPDDHAFINSLQVLIPHQQV